MNLKEFLPKNALSTEKDEVSNYPKFIQNCAKLHEKHAQFIDLIMMCLLEADVTS